MEIKIPEWISEKYWPEPECARSLDRKGESLGDIPDRDIEGGFSGDKQDSGVLACDSGEETRHSSPIQLPSPHDFSTNIPEKVQGDCEEANSAGSTSFATSQTSLTTEGSLAAEANQDYSQRAMARPGVMNSRNNTFSGVNPSPPQMYTNDMSSYAPARNNSQPSLYRLNTDMGNDMGGQVRTPASGIQTQSATQSPAVLNTPGGMASSAANVGLSGFVCNVHRTTGREPKPLVGASTTILGDKLYVFGGRILSRSRPQYSADLYELDLIKRHWSKLEAKGDIPPPRYFHSVCALGDTKLVLYGGMAPANLAIGQPMIVNHAQSPHDPQPEHAIMSDIHIFDIPARSWLKIPVQNGPQARYAHCAAVLPSSAVFSSQTAPHSALHRNPSTMESPNQGRIEVSIDGSGGAEMVVVGGQDFRNEYIEQISVFNLRSLTWTSTTSLGRQCGAYRSVAVPVSASYAAQIGQGVFDNDEDGRENDGTSATLIYSNYNFLDVKLELLIRLPDGTLMQKPMQGNYSPPGLRFPNGGIIDNHFVVSGTFLTSSKQEYALWALDLRTLSWSRIDIGSTIFSQGSWNRGILWRRRNAFVILGNRKRSLVEDYNHRRINFSNLCIVELEAFGFYDNPRRTCPTSGYISASAPPLPPIDSLSPESRMEIMRSDRFASGRSLTRTAEELGRMVLTVPELADMEFLAINGDRFQVNSRLIARRWGPYFTTLLRDSLGSGGGTGSGGAGDTGSDAATLRGSEDLSRKGVGKDGLGSSHRASTATITPSVKSSGADSTGGMTVVDRSSSGHSASGSTSTSGVTSINSSTSHAHTPSTASSANTSQQKQKSTLSICVMNTSLRPRTLFLPHTPLTLQSLLTYLYTSSLPPPHSQLCTPQILCSLLQLARPYRVDGLVEAVVERLHQMLDNRNTAAVFNAAAMAAGGGIGLSWGNPLGGMSGVDAYGGANGGGDGRPDSPSLGIGPAGGDGSVADSSSVASSGEGGSASASASASSASVSGPAATNGASALPKLNTDVGGGTQSVQTSAAGGGRERSNTTSSMRPGTAMSGDVTAGGEGRREEEVWGGGVSVVVGLQKRGLRGLMEGRRIREGVGEGKVGLGIG